MSGPVRRDILGKSLCSPATGNAVAGEPEFDNWTGAKNPAYTGGAKVAPWPDAKVGQADPATQSGLKFLEDLYNETRQGVTKIGGACDDNVCSSGGLALGGPGAGDWAALPHPNAPADSGVLGPQTSGVESFQQPGGPHSANLR
jgi:hypothetical protein